MSANLIEAIQKKLDKLAEAAPKSKIVIVCNEDTEGKMSYLLAYAKELGLEVSVEKEESLPEALQKAAEAHTVTFDIREAIETFEREVNAKRFEIIKSLEDSCCKPLYDEHKSKQREHMKQMQRYQNKHWKK